MRILMATQNYHANVNGAAVFAVRLAEGLVDAGHEVMVLAPSERREAYVMERNGVAVRALAAFPLGHDAFVTPFPRRAIETAIDEFVPDVVHLQDHYPLCHAALKAARDRGLPLLATNHFLPENIISQVALFRRFPRIAGRLMWRQVLAVLNAAAVVTTPTQTAADILVRAGLRRPVEAVSCGVDAERFSPATRPGEDLRARYGLRPDLINFMYLGRVQGDKNLEVLVDAMYRLPEEARGRLLLAGKGDLVGKLRARAEHLGLDGHVRFAGYVPSADLPGVLASADVFTMPSKVELQSIATLEAMAAGRPVLAARRTLKKSP